MKALAGNYRAIAELGCGRLATAWLAEQVGARGGRVLIRVLKPANRQHQLALTRLRGEIATLALLGHPSVARIHECEQAPDGRLYVVTECLDGPSVAGRLVGHGAFPLPDVLEVAGQCARILHIGQQLGIRNRGLRLDSVFMARDASGGWQVKLRDFGLPASLDPSALADGSADPHGFAEPTDSDTPAPDVSALGLAVYAMLTGDPWPGRSGGPLRPVSTIRPDVPTTLDTILWASLDTAARASYQSATEFWSVLRDTLIDDADGEDGATTPVRAVVHRRMGAETDTTRRRFGELLLAERVISPTQLRAALRQQAQWTDMPLGQILMERGWISREQLLSLLQRYNRKYRLGDLLVETNNITEEQLAIALKEQQKSGLRLGELLVQLEYVSDRGMRQALCKQLGIEFVELDAVSPDRAMVRVIPPELASHHRALPIARDGDRLTVALDDPTNDDVVAELERQTGCNIEVVTGERASFRRAFSALYHRAAGTSVEAIAPEPDRRQSSATLTEQATNRAPRQPEPDSGAQEEGSVHQEEIEATLIRLQSQYAALLQEHQAAIQAFRKHEEQYESLMRERQDIAEGLARLAQQFRS